MEKAVTPLLSAAKAKVPAPCNMPSSMATDRSNDSAFREICFILL